MTMYIMHAWGSMNFSVSRLFLLKLLLIGHNLFNGYVTSMLVYNSSNFWVDDGVYV